MKNPVYTGVIKNGDAQSEIIPELQIIDPETFEQAQKIMEARTNPHGEIPLNLSGQSLLVGNIYCGHCRNRLTLTTSGRKYYRKDGTVRKEARARYQCHYNVRHPGECDGQSGYGMKKLDGIVDRIVRYQLSQIALSSSDEIIESQHEKAIALTRARHNILSLQLNDKKRELLDYQSETIKVIRGESKLSMELLNTMIDRCSQEIEELSATLNAVQQELDELLPGAEVERREFAKLSTWADLYDRCSFEAKKMIVSQFIKAVYVHKDYALEIEFNVSFEEFKKLSAECHDQGACEQPLVYVSA